MANKKIIKVWRQGDIAFELVDKPENVQKTNRKIIRRGEHGGVHCLEKGTLFKDIETNEFYVKGPDTIIHTKTHKPLHLPEGWYRVRIQRELSGNIRD